MIKIWGRDTSSNVQKVLWTSKELGIDYQRIDVGGKFGGLNNLDFVNKNPHSKIPVIDDQGFVLFESHAICRYLINKYDKSNLIKTDNTSEIAIIDQFVDWVHTELSIHMIPVLIGLIRTPKEKRNLPLIKEHNSKSEKLWEILDNHLEEYTWISTKNFSIADICCGVWVWRRYELPTEKKKLINIDRWFDNLKNRKEFKAIVMKPLS